MGFGRGSKKEFGKEESRPEWWPEDDSDAKLIWTNYKHPSYTSLEHWFFFEVSSHFKD